MASIVLCSYKSLPGALYQSLHMLSEFTPLILYSEWWHQSVVGRVPHAKLRDLLRPTDPVRYRERMLRAVAIKEWVRSYTIIALGLFLSLITNYRNAAYYPAFAEIEYSRVMWFLTAMLATEMLSTAIITLCFRYLYGVQCWSRATLRFEPGMRWCLLWMALHTTNDVYLSLMECDFK
jgi:hypothetical protein